ncbi:hypothetical protein [Streptomyces sp. NPDC088746]|uniref:hypothetical protein n=1 Tax=Streptomyces sp. NPDC088746 TaxID=3365885 RepID=UPI0037FF6F94
MTTYDFPQDLRDAQLALHRAWSAYEQYSRGLPWSAEPMSGWESDKQLHSSYHASKPDSRGYTEDQHQEIARLRNELLELSAVVSTHPFWSTLERGEVVQGRMTLKHTREQPAVDEAA